VSVLNTLVGNLLVWLVASLSLACKSCMSPGRLSVHLGVSVRWRVVLPEVRILSKMPMRRTEYLARVNIGNSLNRRGWGAKGLSMSGNNIFSSTIKDDFRSDSTMTSAS
jgi:hypothetical protein